MGCRCKSACSFFFQADDGIRDLVRSRGLGDVYKRQGEMGGPNMCQGISGFSIVSGFDVYSELDPCD